MWLALAVLLLHPIPGVAQLPVDAWVRPLVAVPVGGFGGRVEGVEARTSIGFDAGGAITLGALTIYGEYQEVDFGCGECEEAGLEDRALDRGWGAGVIVPLPVSVQGIQPWVRAGVLGHHLRFRLDDEARYSEAALGWSAGLGAEVRATRWLRLEPTVLLRSYDARFGFSLDVPDRDARINYLAVGLGIGLAP